MRSGLVGQSCAAAGVASAARAEAVKARRRMMSSQDFVLLLVALTSVGGDRGDGAERRGRFDCLTRGPPSHDVQQALRNPSRAAPMRNRNLNLAGERCHAVST